MMIPIFLSELVRTVVIMTATAGLMCLLLLAIKPIIRHRLPKSAQYYFWLVVLATFLIPVSRVVALPGRVADIAPIHSVVERNVVSTAEARDRALISDMSVSHFAPGNVNVSAPATAVDEAPPLEEPGGVAQAVTVFMVIYPFVFALVLLYNLIGYVLFIGKLRRNYMRPHSHEWEMLRALTRGRRTPKLIVSDYAATPMLIGIFRPMIVLPNREYTGRQMQSILLHELTHMRRFDVAVKWLSLFACAVHWFNPLVWISKQQIDRVCELSCDEAVILNMDVYGKQHYGETLISVASNTKIPMPVLSTTMCEEKKALKERLTAIMKSKKRTRLAVLVSMFIVLGVVLAACTLGASVGDGVADDTAAIVADDGAEEDDVDDEYPQEDSAIPDDEAQADENDDDTVDEPPSETNDNEDSSSIDENINEENANQDAAANGPGFALIWAVAPNLEHEHIWLCSCGLFSDPDFNAIDPVTGLLTGGHKYGHGGPGPEFVYDRERSLFGQPNYGFFYHDLIGVHPIAEFEAIAPSWILNQSSGLISVQSVDSSLRQYYGDLGIENAPPEWDDYWDLTEEAFTGRFAIMYNRQFVTDFIFDGGAYWWYRFSFNEDGSGRENLGFIAMRQGGLWGLVDRSGNTILPFVFDELIVINESTAFARIDGGWYGILDLTATMAAWN